MLLFIPLTGISKVISDPMQGYVICDGLCNGRLGNQLFIISTALAYSWDNDLKPRFPCLNAITNQLSYNRDKFFFRLNAEPFPYKIQHHYHQKIEHYQEIPLFNPRKNLCLKGYFLSWKYFHHRRAELQAYYEPSEEVMNYLQNAYGELIKRNDTVAVHVRTYSKKYHYAGICFVGLQYFEKAFEMYPKDSLFVVFSDRINWCKVNLTKQFPDRKFLFIEGNDHIEDLFLMSMMRHQIISNSTYSWWAAYLNQNPEKIVTCPQQLIANKNYWPAEDIYLPDWHVIHHDFTKDPYPKDMTLYDELTADDTKTY